MPEVGSAGGGQGSDPLPALLLLTPLSLPHRRRLKGLTQADIGRGAAVTPFPPGRAAWLAR
jgi:hypothetical protein